MPLLASGMAAWEFSNSEWAQSRSAMFATAAIMIIAAYLYWKYTTDCPKGNYDDLPNDRPQAKK